MAIDPKGADLKRLLNEDAGGPVVMLNLLRFASGKRDQYIRYVRELRPFAKKYRGRGLRGRRINPRGRRGWTGMGRGVARSLPDALGFLAHGGRPRVPENHTAADHRADRSGAAGDHALDARLSHSQPPRLFSFRKHRRLM